MYERFFNLRERPFALSPDPDYLYPSKVHREALGYLRYGIESRAGFVVITGEIGSGKTTLLQALLRGLDSNTSVARLVNTLLEPRELLETIAMDLGLDLMGQSKPVLLASLANYLVEQRSAGRLVLLLVDEAQNLGLPALEELRMLSNLETEKSKLLQIVLVGQPELRDKLASPALEQLRQRVTVSYHLDRLDQDETEAYVNHRLRKAALGPPLTFPRDVTDLIHERSLGIPRLINVVCDAALLLGYAEEQQSIEHPLVKSAIAELEATGVLRAVAPVAAGNGHSAPDREGSPDGRPEEPRQAGREHPHGIRRREKQLRAREERLARRERELAEQRRVMAEELRLHQSHESSTGSTLVARRFVTSPAAWPPPGRLVPPLPGSSGYRGSAGGLNGGDHPRRAGAPHEGFWRWLRRKVLGGGLTEDNQ
jgi:general secretion pathway protein A